jgi:hypothetical protein
VLLLGVLSCSPCRRVVSGPVFVPCTSDGYATCGISNTLRYKATISICAIGVTLCAINVLAQEQVSELFSANGSEPAPASPGASPSEIVAIAEEGGVAALDAYDTTRYVRLPGQTASMVYTVEETVSRVTLVVYFHLDTEEQVTLVDGKSQSVLTSQSTQARSAVQTVSAKTLLCRTGRS